MEIKPEMLEKLLKEDNARLWEIIRRVAAMNSIALPATPPPKEEMEKLRALMQSGTIDYGEAVKILSRCKAGEKP